jgi:hypothetical protein
MPNLPPIMQRELAACPRDDCAVKRARGETGLTIVTFQPLLECAACGQIWELTESGGQFTHWDKQGVAHYEPVEYSIGSKWPKGERQCEFHEAGFMTRRFVDADRSAPPSMGEQR